MALAATGLKTHIWNNQLESGLLLAGFPFLLLLLLWLFFALSGYGHDPRLPYDALEHGITGVTRYWYWALIAAGIWFSVAWFSHTSMITMATGARGLSRTEAPEIYNMVENLCISRGMTMPRLQVIDTPMLNAFASGINEKTYTVTLTRGIIDALEKEELEAVIAHELSHIRHKDVRLLIIAVIFVGMISFFAEMLFRFLIYGGGRGRGRDGRLLPIALLVLVIGYVFAIIIRFALSRKREYLADAGAVELTKNPDAMIRALRKISGHSTIKGLPDDIRQMCIDNRAGFMGGMFATHPPIEKRIAALVTAGGKDPGPLAPARRDKKPASSPPEATPWQRRHGPWR